MDAVFTGCPSTGKESTPWSVPGDVISDPRRRPPPHRPLRRRAKAAENLGLCHHDLVHVYESKYFDECPGASAEL